MLTLLNQTETTQVTDHAISNFPRQLLHLIGSADNQRERHLRSRMQTWLPSTVPPDIVHEWVGRSLEWFVKDGHIQRQPGGGYRCLPPYLIGGSQQVAGKAYLYGHPHGTSIMQQQQYQLNAQPVYDAAFSIGPLGYERMYVLPQQRAVRIKIIDTDQIADSLPAIADLREPDVALATALPFGILHCYAPRFAGQAFDKRWISFSAADAHKHKLIRWLPSNEPNDRYAARYFYWSYTQYAVELSYEDRFLWQLKIDAQTHPQHVWWYAQTENLFLPLGLPASYWQWLPLATLERPKRAGHHYQLKTPVALLSKIKNLLVNNLGLVWCEGQPSPTALGVKNV